MDPKKRDKVYRVVIVYFIIVFAAMMWPIHSLFSRIHPIFLGIPFSLMYLVILIFLSFFVLLGLYLWDKSHESENN
jgi:hypothetical protein